MKLKNIALILFAAFLAIVAVQDAYVRHLRNKKIEPRNYTVVLSLAQPAVVGVVVSVSVVLPPPA